MISAAPACQPGDRCLLVDVVVDLCAQQAFVVHHPAALLHLLREAGPQHLAATGPGCFTVTALQPVRYTVEEVSGLLQPTNPTLLQGIVPGSHPPELGPTTGGTIRRIVLIDDNVLQLYGDQLKLYLVQNNVEHCIVPLRTHEGTKTVELLLEAVRAMDAFKLNRRRDLVIAIGGGVCLDVCGMAAALYRRGTPIIKVPPTQVPTTLMGAIDASVGIKNAVNALSAKNKLGTYTPPVATFIDTDFLRTLPVRHLANGAAEMVKMAMIKDAELFELLYANHATLMATRFQGEVGRNAVRRSIQGMLEELEPNLQEHVLWRLVDHGHTFSPMIEMEALRTSNPLLHGEAVAIDMMLVAELAHGRGLLPASSVQRCYELLQGFQLPLWHDAITNDLLYKGLHDTTLARDGQQRLPLPTALGAATFVDDVVAEEVARAAGAVRKRHVSRFSNVVPAAGVRLPKVAH